MRPAAPMIANTDARTERTFCALLVLCARRPLCRSQRSDRNARSKMTTATVEPAMNRGWRPVAPMSLRSVRKHRGQRAAVTLRTLRFTKSQKDAPDIGDILCGIHRNILRLALCQPDNHHGEERACMNRHVDVSTTRQGMTPGSQEQRTEPYCRCKKRQLPVREKPSAGHVCQLTIESFSSGPKGERSKGEGELCTRQCRWSGSWRSAINSICMLVSGGVWCRAESVTAQRFYVGRVFLQ